MIGFTAAAGEGPGEWHILPVADDVAHEPTEECVCGPKCIPIMRACGRVGWLYRHHPLSTVRV